MRTTFKFDETPEEKEDGSVEGTVTLSFSDSLNGEETVFFKRLRMRLRENGEVACEFEDDAASHYGFSRELLERVKRDFKERVRDFIYY